MAEVDLTMGAADLLASRMKQTEPPVTTEPVITTEPVTEPTVVTTEPVTEPIQTDWFDLNKLNERFGTSFQSEDEVKDYIGSLNEFKDYSGKKDWYKTLEATVQELDTQMNPVTRFGSQENYEYDYKLKQLSKGKDSGVVSQILSNDLTKTADIDVLVLGTQYDAPPLASRPIETAAMVLEDIGVEIDYSSFDLKQTLENLTPPQQAKLAYKASQMRSKLTELTGSIQAPEYKSIFETRKQEYESNQQTLQKRLNDWSAEAKRIAEPFTKLEITKKDKDGKESVDFTFDVPVEFRTKVLPALSQFAAESGWDATPENAAKLKGELVQLFKDEYQEQIREAYANEKLSQLRAEYDNKVHNPKPINTTEAPIDITDPNELMKQGMAEFLKNKKG